MVQKIIFRKSDGSKRSNLKSFSRCSNSVQRAWKGGGDRKFPKMVELLGTQNLKMVQLLGPEFAPKRPFCQNFRGFRRRDRFWALDRNRISYLTIKDNTSRTTDIFEKNHEKWPTFWNFFEIFEILKCCSSLNFWPKRNLDPFLEFSDPFLSDAYTKTLKNSLLLSFWKQIFPKIFWKL